MKGRIPLEDLILALKANEKEYVSRQLRGDKSNSAKLWRKLRNVKNRTDYRRIESKFFEGVPQNRRTVIKQELYWKIVDILDAMYFRKTLISKILTVSRLYYRFAGRGDKDAIVNPYEWIQSKSVFWTQVPPWWWYEYAISEIDVTNVSLTSKHIIEHINKILEVNTHIYRIASGLRFITTFKIDPDHAHKLISHISTFLKNNSFTNIYPHYLTVWLIGVYLLVLSRLGFIKTVFDLANCLAEVVPVMRELRKYVEIEYELKYEDDLGFMVSVPKIVELIAASSALNVFGDTNKVKTALDSVVKDPSYKQVVMLQVRVGSWYIFNGYYNEGKKCFTNAVNTMSVDRYPLKTKSQYLFANIWLCLVEGELSELEKRYLPMLKEIRSDPSHIVISHLYNWMANIEMGRHKEAISSAERLYAYASRHGIIKGVSSAIRWFAKNIYRYPEDKLWEMLKEKIVHAYMNDPIETNIERGIPLLKYVEIKRRGIPFKKLPLSRLIDPNDVEINAEKLYSKGKLPRKELLSFANNVLKGFEDLLKSLRY